MILIWHGLLQLNTQKLPISIKTLSSEFMFTDRFGNAVMNFSQNEQDTGMRWVDGRPILMKHIQIDMGTSLHKEVNIGAGGFDYFFIHPCSCLWCAKTGQPNYYYPIGYPGNGSGDVKANVYGNNLVVDIGSAFSGYMNVFYINYMYVAKRS